MKDAWNVLLRYCSYQERCKSEVVKKMQQIELHQSDFEKLLNKLEEANFINEKRYTKSFVIGRYKNKGWGLLKIKRNLLQKGIDPNLIEQVISEEIEIEDYTQKAVTLAEKKWKSVKGKTLFERQAKLKTFLLQKGFEFSTIQEVMQSDIFR